MNSHNHHYSLKPHLIMNEDQFPPTAIPTTTTYRSEASQYDKLKKQINDCQRGLNDSKNSYLFK